MLNSCTLRLRKGAKRCELFSCRQGFGRHKALVCYKHASISTGYDHGDRAKMTAYMFGLSAGEAKHFCNVFAGAWNSNAVYYNYYVKYHKAC